METTSASHLLKNNLCLPTTESANPVTAEIDISDSLEITRLISQCTDELFGTEIQPHGLLDPDFLVAAENALDQMRLDAAAVKEHGFVFTVFLVGAGTSGRLCFMLTKLLSKTWTHPFKVVPVIAGGASALQCAQPNTEDQLESGYMEMQHQLKQVPMDSFVTVGVSCGLSAKYVRGALEASLEKSKRTHLLVGFNHKKDAKIDLSTPLGASGILSLLNPLIGPEPIAGSVRMKGGTATLVLLYSLLSSVQSSQLGAFQDSIRHAQAILSGISEQGETLSRLISILGGVLRSGGNITWLGDASLGPLCIFDAAECPPTFGSYPGQINGFSSGGLSDVLPHGLLESISLGDLALGDLFLSKRMDDNQSSSVFIFKDFRLSECCTFSDLTDIPVSNMHIVHFQPVRSAVQMDSTAHSQIYVPVGDDFDIILAGREVLTHLSTGAFVLAGKVLGNTMIDLRITNQKLFDRAMRIVSTLTDTGDEQAAASLIWSIWRGWPNFNLTFEEQINRAAGLEHVVPMAILHMLWPSKSAAEIEGMLADEPNLRLLLKRSMVTVDYG